MLLMSSPKDVPIVYSYTHGSSLVHILSLQIRSIWILFRCPEYWILALSGGPVSVRSAQFITVFHVESWPQPHVPTNCDKLP